MPTTTLRIRFDKSGYYFIGLLVLAFLGFWNNYFSKFFVGHNDFSFYFHFHAAMMILWVVLLIVQPLLIRKKQVHLHKSIGKATYFIMPLLLTSVLLVLNNGLKNIPEKEISFNLVLFPFRDFILLAVAFCIAIYHRRNIQIHARAMIITGIVFIEPALFRFLNGMLLKGFGGAGGLVAMFLMLSLLITLIVMERNQKSGRWMFPSLLAIYVVAYCIGIFQIPITFLDPLTRWIAALPLT